MPKRKRHGDHQDDVNRTIEKLKRKLKRARKRNRRVSESSSCSSPRVSPQDLDQLVAEQSEEPMTSFDSENQGDNMVESMEPGVIPIAANESIAIDSEPPILENDKPISIASDAEVDDDLLEILGKDLSATTEHGPDLHSELSIRLQHIATAGLDKETRKELSAKYLIPANCMKISAPVMNDEIKAALPEIITKRDKGLENRQKQIASAISCLGDVISSQLQTKNRDNGLLKKLMDATKILCDVQYFDSMKRRYFASTSVKKDISDHITKTKIDRYLFGENLAETLKSAKAVSKSSAEIRVTQNNNKFVRKPVNQQPSTSKNWKFPSTNRRQPSGLQRGRQFATPLPPHLPANLPPPPLPPLARAPPAALSRPSRYQPRQTYRH